MKLSDLVADIKVKNVVGSLEKEVKNLCYHTDQVTNGSVFVCIEGTKIDAHQLIPQAIKKGAIAVVVQKEIGSYITDQITVIQVENTRRALSLLAAKYYDYPTRKMKMIGVTGTKGKTTTAYMIYEILEMAGFKTCLIGTIETIIGKTHIPSDHTTPESLTLQKYFAKAVEEGCNCVVMEVSSQGLKLDRVDGIIFDYAVFLNLSKDHIGGNEHKDFEEYLTCKKKLFLQSRVGIFNVDDPYAQRMMEEVPCQIETFGKDHPAKNRAVMASLTWASQIPATSFELTGWYDCHINLNLPGMFNIYNALAAISVVSHFSVKEAIIRFVLAGFQVKGRVEFVPVEQDYSIMIDYAHNAVSLESILSTLRLYHPNRIICMFGCGGNRSIVRRYEMGKTAAMYADVIVITNDNPRDEDPLAIIEDIMTGVGDSGKECVVIPDRKEAIRYCMKHARKNDLIVLAGKGHETYQEIRGKKINMDERILIKEICLEEGIRIKE